MKAKLLAIFFFNLMEIHISFLSKKNSLHDQWYFSKHHIEGNCTLRFSTVAICREQAATQAFVCKIQSGSGVFFSQSVRKMLRQC